MPQYPVPEQICPEVHEAIANPQIWVVPSVSGSSFRRNQPSPPPVYRQIFLCRRNNASRAYQIIQPPAFQPVELSHGGPVWGYLFMGIVIPRRKDDLIYEEPTEENAQRVAIKRLDLRVVKTELQNGSRENPFKEIWRMQKIGDNIHVVGIVEALQDENYLYIITPWCEGGSLSDNIPLVPNEVYSKEAQARILFQQILEGLNYLSMHGICHRGKKQDGIPVDLTTVFFFKMGVVSEWGSRRRRIIRIVEQRLRGLCQMQSTNERTLATTSGRRLCHFFSSSKAYFFVFVFYLIDVTIGRYQTRKFFGQFYWSSFDR